MEIRNIHKGQQSDNWHKLLQVMECIDNHTSRLLQGSNVRMEQHPHAPVLYAASLLRKMAAPSFVVTIFSRILRFFEEERGEILQKLIQLISSHLCFSSSFDQVHGSRSSRAKLSTYLCQKYKIS